MQTVEILADSLNVETGDRLTTFLIHKMPKILWQEGLTHRVFSRNSASSRAIPIQKVIEQVKTDPFILDWTAHQKGMTGKDTLTDAEKKAATIQWLRIRDAAVDGVEVMNKIGIAKQDANRALEPWMYVATIITSTEWENFWELRCHPLVQPNIKAIAEEMKAQYDRLKYAQIRPGEWHTPFRDYIDKYRQLPTHGLVASLKISTARSARCSYQNHLGEIDPEKDFELHDRLLESRHLSPFEHCAKALPVKARCRNFSGFMSYRAHLEDGVPV